MMRRAATTTGVQLATGSARALLEQWKEQLCPREYAVALDLVRRIVAAELARDDAAQRRWTAKRTGRAGGYD